MEDKCIFCQIASKQLPANIVYEDDHIIAFLDIRPSNPGHTLVVPKKHYETLLDMPEDEAAHSIKVVKHVAESMMDAMNADGFNVLQNNKEAGYQLIPHAHFHVVPRFKDDGLQLGNIRQGSYKDEQEMKDVAAKIKSSVRPVKEERSESGERRVGKGREEIEKDEGEDEEKEKGKKPRSRRLKKEDAFLIRREVEMA